MPFAIPLAVALSQFIGVGGSGCPSSCKVSPMILTSFAFRNSSPSSASAANSPTSLSIWNSVNIAPLRWMGCLSCGFYPRKKYPAARLLASHADKYDASE